MKIITKKESDIKRKYYFLNIPIIKIKDKGYYKTIYIFGIKIRKIYKEIPKKENEELKNIALNILKNRNNIEKEKIAVFLSGYGAVAEYQTKLFTSLDNKYDIFTNSENLEQFNFLKSISKKDCQNIIPYINLDKLNNKEKYLAKIFVLGDSFHHIETLKEAIKTKGEKNRYIMLPEPILLSLFFNYSRMNKIEFKKLMIKIYPFLKDEFQDLDLYKISIKNNCYFIKYLIELTGIHDFIVYTKHNKERILKELNREKINANIKLIYHSYEELKDISKLNIERKNNEFIIGTFGGPSNLKQTKEIIKATNILNKNNFPVKLILSGFNIDDYIEDNKISKDNLIIINTKDNMKFLEAMNTVDLGIQLRPKALSASSGCVAELFALKKEVLINEDFVPDDLKQYFHFVPNKYLSAEEIADAIKNILIKKEYKMNPNNEIFKKYSFENTAKEIYEYIKSKA